MLAQHLLAPLLFLLAGTLAPLAHSMPHSLATSESDWDSSFLDARVGDWKRQIDYYGVASVELEARDVPLNPKNPNFGIQRTTNSKTKTTVRTTSTTNARTTTTTTAAASTTKKTTTTTTTTARRTTTTSTAVKTIAEQGVSTTAAEFTTTFSIKPTATSSTVAITSTSAVAPSVHTGQATYFIQESEGACGNRYADSVPVVALRSSLYGDTTTVGKYCGRYIQITNTDNDKSTVAMVADACSGCSTYYSVSLSTGAFDQIGDQDTGVLPVSWYFLPLDYTPSTGSTTSSIAVTTTATRATTSSSTSASASATPSTSAVTKYTGEGTYFFQDSAGACGNWNKDSVPLVALDYRLYGNMDRVSQYCGRFLTITNTANGKSVVAIVADACPTCASKYSLDLSTGAYDRIGARDTGILSISWSWN